MRIVGLEHAGIADPVAALVFGALPPLKLLLVGGRTVVADGLLCTAEVDRIAEGLRAGRHRIAQRAGASA